MSPIRYDLVVIGSGSAGVHAALQAARLGKKVAIVEKHPERIGGTWLHTGTIPSKTLREVLAATRSIHSHLGAHWVQRLVHNLSSTRLRQRFETVSRDEEKMIRQQLDQMGVEIMPGSAFIESEHSIRVNRSKESSFVIEAAFILIATGSRPRRPPDLPFDGWRVIDSDDVLRLETLPRSITIFGAGVIGCEYACIFAALGIETYIIDARSRIMQFMDQEIAEELRRCMEELGVVFKLGQTLDHLIVDGPIVRSRYNGGLVLETDVWFFAAGRESSSDQLGLERIGIRYNDRRAIEVNAHFQTSIAHIYAAGDVIGPPALASTSAEQGRLAACHAFGVGSTRFPEYYPIGVYTIPEMSSVGRTEEELKQNSVPYVAGRARYDQIARGYIRGDNHGLMKIIVSAESFRILGVHIVGADAANLIHIGQCCMIAGMTLQDVIDSVIFNFPTLAEGYKIAAFDALQQLETGGWMKAPHAHPLKKASGG